LQDVQADIIVVCKPVFVSQGVDNSFRRLLYMFLALDGLNGFQGVRNGQVILT